MPVSEVVVLYDDSLEANRRQAWARYYKARGDLEQLAWWAAELGEWLIQSGLPIPAPVHELIHLVRTPLPAEAEVIIARSVKRQAEETAWPSSP